MFEEELRETAGADAEQGGAGDDTGVGVGTQSKIKGVSFILNE